MKETCYHCNTKGQVYYRDHKRICGKCYNHLIGSAHCKNPEILKKMEKYRAIYI